MYSCGMHTLGQKAWRFPLLMVVAVSVILPHHANAELFGSSFDGCKSPSDDVAGYILDKSHDPTLTEDTIKTLLDHTPTGVTGVSYKNIFEWLWTSENASVCFSKGDYVGGVNIVGSSVGRFAASKTLSVAITSLVGSSAIFPALFEWSIDSLIDLAKRPEMAGLNHQLILYISARESCEQTEERGTDCHKLLIESSKSPLSGSFVYGGFYPNGFMTDAVKPKNPILTNTNAVAALEGKALSPTGVTAQEFYEGAAVIYDALMAKQTGAYEKAREATLTAMAADAKELQAEAAPEGQGSSFFSRFLQAVAKAFKFAGSGIKNLFAKDLSTDKTASQTASVQASNTSLEPLVSVSPLAGKAGTKFDQPGSGFTPDSGATLHFKKPDGTEYPTVEKVTDTKGSYTNTWQSNLNTAVGIYQYWAVDRASKKVSPVVSFEITKTESQTTVKTTPSETSQKTTSTTNTSQTAKASGGAIPGAVTALVVDQYGKPVANAAFSITDEYGKDANNCGDSWSWTQTTNDNGRLEFPRSGDTSKCSTPLLGSYTLRIGKKTYETLELPVEVPKGGLWLNKVILKKYAVASGIVESADGQKAYQVAYWLSDSKGEQVVGSSIGGIGIGGSGYTSLTGRIETIPLPPGHYTLHLECSVNCKFGDDSALKDDVNSVWVKTVDFDIQYSDVSLGTMTLVDKKKR